MEKHQRIITEAARNQLDSSFKMLKTLVFVCSDKIWAEYFNGIPFWYQVYHVAYFIEYWLRENYQMSAFQSMYFDEKIPPEFEHEISSDLFISRGDMMIYFDKIEAKNNLFFDGLDDPKMLQSTFPDQDNFTYSEVIMTQIRHIMYNVGYLNGILRNLDAEESDWYAYNEDND